MKDFFLKHIRKQLQCWGVVFESDLPPEFVVSHHAEQRLAERVGVKKDKMVKMVMKAWNAKTPNMDKWGKKLYENKFRKDGKYIEFREMMGYLFIFNSKNKMDTL